MLIKTFKVSIYAFLSVANNLGTLVAQQAVEKARLQFEVASVKHAQRSPLDAVTERMFDGMPDGRLPMPNPGRLHIQGWSLRRVVAAAYRVRTTRVSGPQWIEDTYFDIEAKLPVGARFDDAHEMLQALLAERFELELHRERHESAGFALVVAKAGARLEEFVPSTAPEGMTPEESLEYHKEVAQERLKALQARMADQKNNTGRTAGITRFSWTGLTATELADNLARAMDKPVVDETGLSGQYNVNIEISRRADDAAEQTIFAAVQKIGLKLAPRKVPVDFLVIDRVSKTPSAN